MDLHRFLLISMYSHCVSSILGRFMGQKVWHPVALDLNPFNKLCRQEGRLGRQAGRAGRQGRQARPGRQGRQTLAGRQAIFMDSHTFFL